MTRHAVIFDFENTLAPTQDARRTAFNLAFDRLNVGTYWSKPLFARISEGCRPGQEAACWTARSTALGQKMPRNWNRAQVEGRARESLLNFIENGFLRLSSGAAGLLGDLALASLSVSVITDGPREEMEAVFMARGDRDLLDRLTCLCGAEDLALPEIGAALERAADASGVEEGACIVVSARAHVLERAQQLGFHTLALHSARARGGYPWHNDHDAMLQGGDILARIMSDFSDGQSEIHHEAAA